MMFVYSLSSAISDGGGLVNNCNIVQPQLNKYRQNDVDSNTAKLYVDTNTLVLIQIRCGI